MMEVLRGENGVSPSVSEGMAERSNDTRWEEDGDEDPDIFEPPLENCTPEETIFTALEHGDDVTQYFVSGKFKKYCFEKTFRKVWIKSNSLGFQFMLVIVFCHRMYLFLALFDSFGITKDTLDTRNSSNLNITAAAFNVVIVGVFIFTFIFNRMVIINRFNEAILIVGMLMTLLRNLPSIMHLYLSSRNGICESVDEDSLSDPNYLNTAMTIVSYRNAMLYLTVYFITMLLALDLKSIILLAIFFNITLQVRMQMEWECYFERDFPFSLQVLNILVLIIILSICWSRHKSARKQYLAQLLLKLISKRRIARIEQLQIEKDRIQWEQNLSIQAAAYQNPREDASDGKSGSRFEATLEPKNIVSYPLVVEHLQRDCYREANAQMDVFFSSLTDRLHQMKPDTSSGIALAEIEDSFTPLPIPPDPTNLLAADYPPTQNHSRQFRMVSDPTNFPAADSDPIDLKSCDMSRRMTPPSHVLLISESDELASHEVQGETRSQSSYGAESRQMTTPSQLPGQREKCVQEQGAMSTQKAPTSHRTEKIRTGKIFWDAVPRSENNLGK